MRAQLRILIVALGAGSLYVGCGGDSATDGGPGVDAGPVDAMRVDAPGTDGGSPDLGTDGGPPPACDVPVIPTLHTQDLVAGHSWDNPVVVAQAPGDDTAFYVVEQSGVIQVVRGTMVTPFLDVTSIIVGSAGGGEERGLLGLAFHPDYATNGRFFIGFTPIGTPRRNRIAEYHRSAADAYVADPAQVALLVDQADPESNHNGGWVGFGPDGFLYATIGDGGGGCDAHGGNGNGQSTMTLLGKMLRLDVDNGPSYAAAGNPFDGTTGLTQIWAYGLRNAWRNSFDRTTGNLWIGDVGQNAWEEIDFQPAASTGGENYGWEAMEGTHPATDSCTSAATAAGPLTAPITDYSHSNDGTPLSGGAAVTGGYVYRGSAIPALAGVYLYADYGNGQVAALRYCGGTLRGPIAVPSLSGLDNISSFGQDNQGELYLVGIGGMVAKIIP